MDITPFIRELLFSHDCVILPGFGGFIGNYSPARIDKNTSAFYPPAKQISFNRNINNNDGLLAGRISESLKFNYAEACNVIEEFVSSVRKRLEKGEKVVFDNIGSFIYNREGNIQFEPDRNVNYYLGSYGLESFQFTPLEGYDLKKRITRHIEMEPVQSSSMRKILWRAAVIVPLLALMVVISLKTDLLKPKLETTTLNPIVTADSEYNKKAIEGNNISIPEKPEEITPQPADNNLQAAVPVAEETIITAVEEDGFYLITGSFKLKENADQQVNMLKAEGFSPELINGPNGFFRVSAMRCSNLATAVERKNELIKQFPGTWVKKI